MSNEYPWLGLIRSSVNTPSLTSYEVDLEAQTSSCRWRQLLGFPCSHVLTSLREKKLPKEKYWGECFITGNFRLPYDELNPLADMSQCIETVYDIVVDPPRQQRQIERQSKLCVWSKGEGKKMKRGRCGSYGPKNTCKGPTYLAIYCFYMFYKDSIFLFNKPTNPSHKLLCRVGACILFYIISEEL